jgi:hypothetical protein
MRRLGIAIAIVLCACYSPSYQNCAIACDDVSGCPSGLSCESATHMCTSGASCTGGSDGSGSGSGSGSGCWSMPTSNFDPCVTGFPAATKALDTSVMAPVIDTDVPSCLYAMTSGGSACLLHYTSITIASGKQLGVTGHLPLILVSDGPVEIDAPVTMVPGSIGHGGCDARQGSTGNAWNGGGAGAGNGSAGGSGGADDMNVIRAGGTANGTASLVPLVGGCQGGNGGQTGSVVTAGGNGGGALEISSKTSIALGPFGLVVAAGGGGTGGMGMNGGGGGGAGGEILLEAPDLAIAGAVCAPGGGGGQGAVGTAGGAGGGTSSSCAAGSGAGGNQGTGGVGGSSPTALPGNGAPASPSGGFGGGGGGGAYGRIHFHTLGAATGSGLVKPPPI